jgi:hypothetical protein
VAVAEEVAVDLELREERLLYQRLSVTYYDMVLLSWD